MSDKNVMVFIEYNNGKIADVSLELISEAKKLASKLGSAVTAVAIGDKIATSLPLLGYHGCSKVFLYEDKRLANFTSVPYAKIVVETIKKYNPYIVLFGATTNGRDVAPRVASELKCGLTADCTDLQIGEHDIKDKVYKDILLQIRPAFGGNIIATIVSPESIPSMATVREGVMKISPPNMELTIEIVKEEHQLSADDFMSEVLEIVRKERSVNLKGAAIVVSAGMGAADEDSFALVKELAKTVGGVVGASRPFVDSGRLERDRQVGQTGKTVRPNLYIACGISGAVQHTAGMSESKVVVAINTDPNAEIFKAADFGILGDAKNFVQALVREIRKLR